jgi:serine/threonine protein kinase
MSNENYTIDKYELIEKLGEGAFGVVYKAKNLLFDKIIALKIIKGASREQLNSFLREIRKMDKLTPSHENVMRIISADIKDDLLLIEMEYFEGKTLLKLLKELGALDDDIIFEYVKQILDALSFIHSKRLVHRDIKPDNILLSKDCSKLKVSDFGISKDLDYSTSDSIQGAFLYMSPEQLTDPSKVDHRSDFYSLAIVIYQLKTGKLPFSGTITNIIDGKRFKTIPKTNSFLDPIILKASKKNPKERFANAKEFKNELIRVHQKKYKQKNGKLIYWFYVLVLIAILGYNFKDSLLKSFLNLNEKKKIIQTKSPITEDLIKTDSLIWMKNNLNVTRFRNGDSIFEAKTKEDWKNAGLKKIPAFCYIKENGKILHEKGVLYNWYALKDGRLLCPEGFRLPKKEDWENFFKCNREKNILDEFNSFYSGYKNSDGYSVDFGKTSVYWTNTEKYKGCEYAVIVSKNNKTIKLGEQKPSSGFLIRCVKW